VYVTGGARFVMAGTAEIRGNNASSGSGLYIINEGSSFTFEGGVIGGNTATRSGSIYLSAATVLLNGGLISGNTSEYGGGVYMTQNARLVMRNNAEIRGNRATRGGGVYVANGAQLVLEGGMIQNNSPNDIYE